MTGRHPLIGVMIIVMIVGSALPAAAITFGVQDGEGHPYVGLVVFEGQSPVGPIWPCSGVLLSPTVFLTAGHCTYGANEARVWFDSDLTNNPDYPNGGPSSIEADQIHTHPSFDEYTTFPNTSDIGLVILAVPVLLDEYGELPPLAMLDNLTPSRGRKDIIRTVGYGYQMVKPFFQWEPVRYTSTSKLVNLRSHLTDGYNIHTSNNPGKGQGTGGSCFGDSGGPIFYPQDGNTVVGIVSFGLNDNCKGAGFAYRTDIWETQNFILDFLLTQEE